MTAKLETLTGLMYIDTFVISSADIFDFLSNFVLEFTILTYVKVCNSIFIITFQKDNF